jgi:hypothetical protein
VAKSISQILSYTTLTGSIQATTSGIPNPFPPAFFKSTKKVTGNRGRYTRFTGERRTARSTKYGAPARNRGLRDVGEVDVKLLHTFESQTMDPLVMKQLRSKDSYELDKGLNEVSRQVTEFKRLFDNLRVAAVAQVLRNGILYFDGDGNLLPSSSGAVDSHSFQMSANNQNQLNSIITASWALNTTDIPLQLRNLKKRSRRLTGYPLKYAFYGESIPSYLTANDYVLDYLARNPTMQAKWLDSAEIPDGLFGFTWVPAYEAFYEDADGTNQDLWNGDSVVFTPEVSDDWWEFLEGSFEVPTTVNVMTDAEAAMRSLATQHGMFGYGVVTHNPPTVCGYYGDTFIPALKVPDAIFQADVTP